MKTKAHPYYRNKEGKIVPGVTTVLSVLSKPALIRWAWNLGMQGIDYQKYVDDLAEVGAVAHYLIECDLKGEEPDLSGFSQETIERAENSLLSYFEWRKRNPFTKHISEVRRVSEIYQYGGQCDLVFESEGGFVLADFKTGKSIYPEMVYQLAAYKQLVEETEGWQIKEARIIRIGRTEDEGFEERVYKDLFSHFEIFKSCLNIYNLQKQLNE